MPSIFLSYSREDLSRIEQLEAQLKTHSGISIWRDQEKIYGGQKWPKVLGEAIADQDVVLLAWSKHAAISHFVEFEWCTAIALKKTIVPCLLDSTTLPPSLAAINAISVDDLPKIVAALTGADLAEDSDRRTEVVNKLGQITTTKPEEVLLAARSFFDQRGWTVHGPVIQAHTVHYYYLDPSKPSNAAAHERYLKGRVLLIEDNDELTPAVGVCVTLLQSSDSVVTGPEGLFTLLLPDSCQPGIKVECSARKDGWEIFSPLAGEITIPALDTDLVKVRLVKKGSTKLLSAESVKKLIQDMVGKSTEQIRPEGKLQEIDISRYIQDWATKYGFSLQRVMAEIDKWVTEAEQQNDPHQLGLAAYAKKNFGQASKLFEASAERRLKQIDEAKSKARQLTEEAATDFRLAGDARYSQYEFDSALTLYQQALQLVSKEEEPKLWADIIFDIGRANSQVGLRTHGDRIHHHLDTAVQAYRDALTVRTKAALPQDWATTQNNLGATLREQGIRTGGEAGTRLLAEAVTAYREALTVRTKEQLPQGWAMTQNNLGNVLQNQGTRTGGEAGTRLLAEAVAAYREALTVRTKEQLPQDWAMTQNNLGATLNNQGTRTGVEAGTRLLAEAVAAYREALTVYTKDQLPQHWAATQNNLGAVLGDQGTRTVGEAGTRLLAEAVAAYREALKIRTREHLSQDWAQTQNNLAKALLQLEDWQGAVEAYRSILTLYPDYDEGYVSATALYQEKLFAYPEAFALSQQWLERHPEDLFAQTNFAEAHFTTGRFAEAETRTAALLANPKLDLNTGLAMRTLHVATLIALNKPASVPPALTALRDFVQNLPSDFESNWSFEGSKHFIGNEPTLAPSRAWLLELFSAVEEKDGRKRLAAVEKILADLPTMKRNQ